MDISAKESGRKSRRAKLEVTGSPRVFRLFPRVFFPRSAWFTRILRGDNARNQRGSGPFARVRSLARDSTTIMPEFGEAPVRVLYERGHGYAAAADVFFFLFAFSFFIFVFLHTGRLQQIRREPVAGRWCT